MEELTINSNEIYSEMVNQMDEKQVNNLDQLLNVSNEMLFENPETNTLIDHLEQSQNIGKDLGEGAFSFFMTLMQQSQNMPGDIVDPYAMIMIARVAEYLSEVGVAITDEDYETAVHTFVTLVHSKYDPDFQAKMAERGIGQTQEEPSQNMTQANPVQSGTQSGILGGA